MKTDAVVIGAGIIGCATAFELAKKGYRVITVDKNIFIDGLDINNRPVISIDFGQPTWGFTIFPANTLTLRNIDIQALNYNAQTFLNDVGTLQIEGRVEISE